MILLDKGLYGMSHTIVLNLFFLALSSKYLHIILAFNLYS